jgi:U6 snRNA-associated Sm-like protein LSm1
VKSYVLYPLGLSSISPNAKQDLDKEDEVPLQQVDYRQLEPYVKQDAELKKQHDELKAKALYDHKGFCKEGGEGDGY